MSSDGVVEQGKMARDSRGHRRLISLPEGSAAFDVGEEESDGTGG